MIRLIKNEFIKISKRKSIYGIIIIFFLFSIFSTYNKTAVEEYDFTYNEMAALYTILNQMMELETYNQIREYVKIKTELDKYELMLQYEKGSWQYNYIKESDFLFNLLQKKNEFDYNINAEDAHTNELQEEYQNILDVLNSENWRFFISKEIEETKEQLIVLEDNKNTFGITKRLESEIIYNKEKISVLNWRLDKNISYATSYLDTALEKYLISYYPSTLNPASYEYKLEVQNSKENIAINKYIIDNFEDINENLSTRTLLLNLFDDDCFIFIAILIVFITSIITTEEYSRGTIKTLLTKPYSRMQILLSKYLVCFIIIVISIILASITQLLVGGMFFGFKSLKTPVILYNFNSGGLTVVNIFIYIFIQFLLNIPKLLLLMSLSFSLGILIKNNAINIVLIAIISIVFSILNLQVSIITISYMKYFITLNYDFRQYLFGRLPRFELLNPGFSFFICIIHLFVLLIPTFIAFKKADIKNL